MSTRQHSHVRQRLPLEVTTLRRRIVSALLLTHERLLTRVCSHVHLEGTAMRRRKITASSSYKNGRSPECVRMCTLILITRIRRIVTALLLALEWQLTRMHPHVLLKMTALRRRLVTALLLALEKPLTCVRSHVRREISALRHLRGIHAFDMINCTQATIPIAAIAQLVGIKQITTNILVDSLSVTLPPPPSPLAQP